MFLMIGISTGQKQLNFVKSIICSNCSKFGRYEIYMVYTSLTLFFIPILKWNKHYYVKTTCCQKTYELNPNIGKKIHRGEDVDIKEEDLTPLQSYANFGSTCPVCGNHLSNDYIYCPKCGHKL